MSQDAYEILRQEALSRKVDSKQTSSIILDLPLGNGKVTTFEIRREGSCHIFDSKAAPRLLSSSEAKNIIKEIFILYDPFECKHLTPERFPPRTVQDCLPLDKQTLDLQWYFINRYGIRRVGVAREVEDPNAEISEESPLYPIWELINQLSTF